MDRDITRVFGSFPAALAAILLAFPIPGTAQEYRGRVQGVVSDTTGAVVPAAPVTLTNKNTGVAVTRQTNERGSYTSAHK